MHRYVAIPPVPMQKKRPAAAIFAANVNNYRLGGKFKRIALYLMLSFVSASTFVSAQVQGEPGTSIQSVTTNTAATDSSTPATDGTKINADKKADTLPIADPTIFSYTRPNKDHKGKSGADNPPLYYLYGTGADRSVSAGFKGFVSRDLKHWQRILPAGKPDYLVLDSAHNFGNRGFWAPQVLALGGDRPLIMAYTANEQIALARSTAGPAGPFTQQKPVPLFKDGFKHIDPFIFPDSASNKTFIYYVKLQAGNKIYVAELQAGPKGEGFSVKPGTEKRCIQATDRWENTAAAGWPVTEGPTVLFHRGYYYLFYSANDFRSPDYSVGYAVSKSPTGPWVKSADNPIITGVRTGLSGTGHGDVFRDQKGGYYYVFHAHHNSAAVGPRQTYLIGFRFEAQQQGRLPDRIEMDDQSVTPLLLTP